jgi:type II pantothenate kinase
MRAGIDFGLTVTDVVAVEGERLAAHAALVRPGPASPEVLRRALATLDRPGIEMITATGGRSRELPEAFDGLPLRVVDEPQAVGRGGLALAGLERALVVSCGTGTAMIRADAALGRFDHVTGTPVGGGTLEGLGSVLLGTRDVPEIVALASAGSVSGVDTTLGDVLGGGVGTLPPRATAVSFGRLAGGAAASREDLAASLVIMVAQTIGLVAHNAALAHGVPAVVVVGRLAEVPPIRSMIEAVFRVYGAPPPVFPAGAAYAAALGAALSG